MIFRDQLEISDELHCHIVHSFQSEGMKLTLRVLPVGQASNFSCQLGIDVAEDTFNVPSTSAT